GRPLSRSNPCSGRIFLHLYSDHWPFVAARTGPKEGFCRLAFLGAAAPVRGDTFLFQPGDRLLEALDGVAIPGVVGRMVGSDTSHLLLEGGKALELSLRHVGQAVGAFLKLAVQARQSAETENEVGELLLYVSRWCLALQKREADEGAVA